MKRVEMSVWRLLRLAAGRGLAAVLVYVAVWDVILAVLCVMGRMSLPVTLITLAVIGVLIFAALIHGSFQAKHEWANVRAMYGLLKDSALRSRIKGKSLTYENGAWQYSDETLFVRVNDASACILFAPALDLKKPALHSMRRIYDNGKQLYAKYHEYDMLEFQKADGGILTARSDKVVPLQDWLTARGGRIVHADLGG